MRKTFLLVITGVLLGALAAYADCFPTIGLGNLSANNAIIQSGKLDQIKSLSLNFENRLEKILRAAGQGPKWIESVNSAMQKGAMLYNQITFDMFLSKLPNLTTTDFVYRWNWGDLELSANTKDKIIKLVSGHFKQLTAILQVIPRQAADLKCPGCMASSSGGAGPR